MMPDVLLSDPFQDIPERVLMICIIFLSLIPEFSANAVKLFPVSGLLLRLTCSVSPGCERTSFAAVCGGCPADPDFCFLILTHGPELKVIILVELPLG